jgi:hypothetical protein
MSELIDNGAQERKDLLKKRALQGQQRLLSWKEDRSDA